MSRRYEKRFDADLEDETPAQTQGRGYGNFGEMTQELETVIDVVWVSGTRRSMMIKCQNCKLTLRSFSANFLLAHDCSYNMHKLACLPICATPYIPYATEARPGLLLPIAGRERRDGRAIIWVSERPRQAEYNGESENARIG